MDEEHPTLANKDWEQMYKSLSVTIYHEHKKLIGYIRETKDRTGRYPSYDDRIDALITIYNALDKDITKIIDRAQRRTS